MISVSRGVTADVWRSAHAVAPRLALKFDRFPGTNVPGYHMPPLCGWENARLQNTRVSELRTEFTRWRFGLVLAGVKSSLAGASG